MAFVGGRVVVLDGARDDAIVLDADTLEEVGRIAIPAGRRTEVPGDTITGGHGFWIGHKTYDIDALAGNRTAVGLSRIDVRHMAITASLPTPACGSKGGIEVDVSTLVDATECSYEVEIRDLRRGATRSLPGYQVRPEVALLGGRAWVRWSDVGYAGSLDTAKRPVPSARLRRRRTAAHEVVRRAVCSRVGLAARHSRRFESRADPLSR